MISRAEILMGRDKEYPLTPELEANLARLLEAVNKMRTAWGKPLIVTSGYRPGVYNTRARGAAKSAHLTCEAIDIADPAPRTPGMSNSKGPVATWLQLNQHKLIEFGLWMEDPAYTKGWVHLQVRPIRGTSRIFQP